MDVNDGRRANVENEIVRENLPRIAEKKCLDLDVVVVDDFCDCCTRGRRERLELN
jgi:hypothetical protein